MTEITEALEVRAQQTPENRGVLDLIDRMRPEIEKLIPGYAERLARIVVTEMRRTPRLFECSPESLLGAMMQCAQLGLEPGPLGHVYLVPFKRNVQLIVGYKGIIDLAYRSDRLKSIITGTVREGDAFAWREGTRSFLDHTPCGPPDGREPTHYYAVAKLTTGGVPFKVLFPEDVEAARKRSQSGSSDQSPWSTDYRAMAEKTAVRRLAPVLPQSPVFAQALAVDYLPAEPMGDDVEGVEE